MTWQAAVVPVLVGGAAWVCLFRSVKWYKIGEDDLYSWSRSMVWALWFVGLSVVSGLLLLADIAHP